MTYWWGGSALGIRIGLMPNEHAPKHLLCLKSGLEFVMASTYTIDQEALRKSLSYMESCWSLGTWTNMLAVLLVPVWNSHLDMSSCAIQFDIEVLHYSKDG